MIFSAESYRPDPAKVKALKHITRPNSKEEVVSFLCMMQSNAMFIQNFAKQSAPLRELIKGKKTHKFKWLREHQDCFEELISQFEKLSMNFT